MEKFEEQFTDLDVRTSVWMHSLLQLPVYNESDCYSIINLFCELFYICTVLCLGA